MNNTFYRKDISYRADRLRSIIKKYDISYNQAITWFKRTELIFWFLQGVELVKKGELSLDAVIIIGSYITPGLSVIETAELYDKIVLDAHRQWLLGDLTKYITPIYDSSRHHKDRALDFMKECKSIKTTASLFNKLEKQNDLFKSNTIVSQTSIFNWGLGLFSSVNKKHKQPYGSKEKDNYTETIERHTVRLQRRLQF
jgi:hypothetical protein